MIKLEQTLTIEANFETSLKFDKKGKHFQT
jgi:hypothetical protein